jgi:kynurenine formamidase
MIVKLSYNLSENTPFPENLPKPKLDPLCHFSKGDPVNSFYFTTSNHAGTHVDAPNHFCPDGRTIAEYSMEELIFEWPTIVDLPLSQDELVTPAHFSKIDQWPQDCHMLLIRSGFSRYRTSDPKIYVESSPGFSRAAADYLMSNLPGLKACAIDWISFASTAHMSEGIEAHRVFLGYPGYSDRSILLVEDLFIPNDLPVLKKIYVIPLFFEGLDSAPCTVFAEV